MAMDDKRILKCIGCTIKHTQHEFGKVGLCCTNPEKEQPASEPLFGTAMKVEPTVRKRPLSEENE